MLPLLQAFNHLHQRFWRKATSDQGGRINKRVLGQYQMFLILAPKKESLCFRFAFTSQSSQLQQKDASEQMSQSGATNLPTERGNVYVLVFAEWSRVANRLYTHGGPRGDGRRV